MIKRQDTGPSTCNASSTFHGISLPQCDGTLHSDIVMPAHLQHVTEVCYVGPGVLQEGELVPSSLQVLLQGRDCCDAGRQVGARLGQLLLGGGLCCLHAGRE